MYSVEIKVSLPVYINAAAAVVVELPQTPEDNLRSV